MASKRKQENQWELLITRETVLLERYLRILGYRSMFNKLSRVRVKNLLVINENGLTSQYVYLPEAQKRFILLWSEFQKGYLKKFLPYWQKIINILNIVTKLVLLENSAKGFKKFIKYYQLGRAIVFYTNDLCKILESKGLGEKAKKIGQWHERTEVETCKAWDNLAPFFDKVAKRYQVTQEELMYYLPNEFLILLEKGRAIEKSILKQRKEYYVLHMHNGKIKFHIGDKARAIEQEQLLLNQKYLALKTIRGQDASPGFVKGKVRLVNTQSQMKQIKKGEILVSIMTTPRLIPAMKKASAIVTDEGGITCHAAIVSRELGIPCIIGTKIATRVLEDGDLVEVDANKGIVRILK